MTQQISLPRGEFYATDIELAIEQIRQIAQRSHYGDLTRLIDGTPEPDRDRVLTLLRDVLVRQPDGVLYGAPVMLYVREQSIPMPAITLPLPDCAPLGVRGCAWISLRNLHGLEPFGDHSKPVKIQNCQMEAAVLLLRCEDEEPPVLSDFWWGHLFGDFEGVFLSAPSILPWPDAMEAACAMLANAMGSSRYIDTPQLFLPYSEYLPWQDEGKKFRAKVGGSA